MGFFADLGQTFEQTRKLRERNTALADALEQAEKRIHDLQRQADSTQQSPFFSYRSSFDALATMRRHEVQARKPTPGFQTNWLGVLVDPKIYAFLADQAGKLDHFPMPANWHADIAEWASALRAVELSAPGQFSMLELGCGWGCWMNNTGLVAKRTGRKVHVIGIEGDEGHLQFAKEALTRNGFAQDEYTLHRGIAAATGGTALFPRQGQAGQNWGLEPIFLATQEQMNQAVASGTHDALPMISLEQALGGLQRLDLLHIDIQGGEADLVESCLPLLSERVAYLLIGTHSKHIEGRLFDILQSTPWTLEMERPALYQVQSGKPVLEVDGVQAWRNPLFQ